MKRYLFLCLVCLLHSATAFSPVLPPVSDLPADQVRDFEDAAEIYLSSFQRYLGEIAKTNDATKANRLFEHVKDLFLNQNQIIEVGWLAGNGMTKERYTVQKYLERLQARKKTVYSRVEISEYQKSSMANPFTKTNEKNVFKAIYLYHQTFMGYQTEKGKNGGIEKEKLLYGDKTVKRVEVFADKRKANETQVKLGNVYVDSIELITRLPQIPKESNQTNATPNEGNQIENNVRSAETLLDQVSKGSPARVHLVGKKGNITRTLTLAQFKEKYAFDEFKRYTFKETKNKEAIIQLR